MPNNSNPWGVPSKQSNAVNVGSVLNDWLSGVQRNIKSGTASTGITPKTAGIIKPGTMASNYGAGAGMSASGKPNVIGKPAAAMPAPTYTQAPSASAAAGGTAKKASPLSDLLRVPGLEDIYNPILKQLEDQAAATSKRYEANQANLANIFGALSGLAA
jgi:hypothetical protein